MVFLLVVFANIAEWLERHNLPCFYKKYLGVDCPGCGMQRSVIELLKGNFFESFNLYPALSTTIALFVLLIFHIIFKLRNGAKYLLLIFIINAIIITINFMLKFN